MSDHEATAYTNIYLEAEKKTPPMQLIVLLLRLVQSDVVPVSLYS
jgi:hypothetical protein